MNQGPGLSTLALNYAKHSSQTCIHIIAMDSQLFLLSGNNHQVVSVHTNIHGKGNQWERFNALQKTKSSRYHRLQAARKQAQQVGAWVRKSNWIML